MSINRAWAIRTEQRVCALEKQPPPTLTPQADALAELIARIEALEAKAHVHVGRPTKVAE